MLKTDAKGVLLASTNAWTFTPDAANTATVKVPDADYAYFGWWLNKRKTTRRRTASTSSQVVVQWIMRF